VEGETLPRFRASQAASSSLSATDRLFAAAFENAPHPMALIDADGSILEANGSLCRMLGFTRAELWALSSDDITHPDDAETERQQRRRLAAADIARYELVQRYVRKDLRTIWAQVSVSAVRSSSDQAAFFVAELEPVPPYGCREEVMDHEVWFARLGDATLSAIHEIGNTLTPLMLNTEMLVKQSTGDEVGQSAQVIFKAARRIAFALRRLRRIHDPQSVAYVGQNRMLDLRLVAPPQGSSVGTGEAGVA
jgi:PAS domain S-box-containing protein